MGCFIIISLMPLVRRSTLISLVIHWLVLEPVEVGEVGGVRPVAAGVQANECAAKTAGRSPTQHADVDGVVVASPTLGAALPVLGFRWDVVRAAITGVANTSVVIDEGRRINSLCVGA
jgi:hypothetical protein